MCSGNAAFLRIVSANATAVCTWRAPTAPATATLKRPEPAPRGREHSGIHPAWFASGSDGQMQAGFSKAEPHAKRVRRVASFGSIKCLQTKAAAPEPSYKPSRAISKDLADADTDAAANWLRYLRTCLGAQKAARKGDAPQREAQQHRGRPAVRDRGRVASNQQTRRIPVK